MTKKKIECDEVNASNTNYYGWTNRMTWLAYAWIHHDASTYLPFLNCLHYEEYKKTWIDTLSNKVNLDIDQVDWKQIYELRKSREEKIDDRLGNIEQRVSTIEGILIGPQAIRRQQ